MQDVVKQTNANGDYAEFSPCGKYRYLLVRKNPILLRWVKRILFVMLNPSTADAFKNDPTIRRCIYFAGKYAASELVVVNLFALRSPNPKDLKKKNPIGPMNEEKIRLAVDYVRHSHGFIVAAWGANPIASEQGKIFIDRFGGQRDIWCLGKSENGSPRHPLYIKKDKELEEYK